MQIRWTHWVAALSFWLLVGLVSSAQVWWPGAPANDTASHNQSLTWHLTFSLLWVPLTVGLWRLSAAWALVGLARYVTAHALTLAPAIFVHGGVLSLIAGREPLKSWLLAEIVVYAAVAASGLAFVLHRRWRERHEAASALEGQLAQARLSTLDARLQPHFLLNSLDAIESLVRDGDRNEALRLVGGTRDLLRQVVGPRAELHRVSDELALVETFFAIQRGRFGNRLHCVIETSPGVAAARVPPLLILPLAENALRHGLSGERAQGLVRVSVQRRAEMLVIKVEDDGRGVEDHWRLEASRGTGLANLRARLQALYGDAASLSAGSSGHGRGFSVTARLPFQE